MAFNQAELVAFRKNLHRNAERSGEEEHTARIIKDTLEIFEPNEIITNLGGHGVAAIFEGNHHPEKGPSIVIRAEMDAIPVGEKNTFNYASKNPNVAHLCGHDGHMAILMGVASKIKTKIKNRPGRVILLFQPAEETGAGAKAVLDDEKFQRLLPDYAFALHNFPGFKEGEIITKTNVMLLASKGMLVNLNGKTSHAAYPEHGVDPNEAIIKIRSALLNLPNVLAIEDSRKNTFVTVPHMQVGVETFGSTPGHGKIMATLRAFREEKMEELTQNAEELVQRIVQAHNIQHPNHDITFGINWEDSFPPTKNHGKAIRVIRDVSQRLKYRFRQLRHPLRWSEDFSYFGRRTNEKGIKIKTGFFGVGAGENHPDPHNHEYDFPDNIIPNCIRMYQEIILEILGNAVPKEK